jgi:hypothetical protein
MSERQPLGEGLPIMAVRVHYPEAAHRRGVLVTTCRIGSAGMARRTQQKQTEQPQRYQDLQEAVGGELLPRHFIALLALPAP